MKYLVIFHADPCNKSYVLELAGCKFGINFSSCSENDNFAGIATTSGIYPKNLLLLMLSQINTIASFVKVQTRFTMSSGFFALLTLVRHAVKVANRSGLIFLCMGRRLTHFPVE